MTKSTRARYTLEFKEEAVRLVTGGERVATVARNLGLSEQTLHNWVKAAGNGGLKSSAAPAVSAEQMEISRLRTELSRVKMERDILKKTIADRSSACGRRNGWRYPGRWRGAAVGFLVAYDPVKKHGPRAGADLGMVTPSWRSRLGS